RPVNERLLPERLATPLLAEREYVMLPVEGEMDFRGIRSPTGPPAAEVSLTQPVPLATTKVCWTSGAASYTLLPVQLAVRVVEPKARIRNCEPTTIATDGFELEYVTGKPALDVAGKSTARSSNFATGNAPKDIACGALVIVSDCVLKSL